MDSVLHSRHRASRTADSGATLHRRRLLSSSRFRRSLPNILVVLGAALGITASGAARSPVAAFAACLVAGATAVYDLWLGATTGAVAIVLLLAFDPFLSHAPRLASHAAALLVACAVAVPALWRRSPRRREIDDDAGAPRSSRARETPARGTRALSADPRRLDGVDLETSIEHDIVLRFLRDMRDALGGDEVVLWEYVSATDDPIPRYCAVSPSTQVTFQTSPPADSLVHWAIQQGMPASNYETEETFFVCAPVGKEGRFLGALGVYAQDRHTLSRERVKTFIGPYASRLAMLLDLLADGKATRRYRGKADKVVRAAERILGKQELVALGQAICETALEVSGGTRAAFVHWAPDASAGQVASVSSPHTIEPGQAVAPDSLVGIACRERQPFSIREAFRMSQMALFAPGEPSRRVNSVAIVPLQRNQVAQGAIVVEGDEEGQMTAVEGELLSMLAPVASVALENVTKLVKVTELSRTDQLTALPNRRSFDDRLRQHLAESDRFGHPTALVLCDIDHFKAVNDTYGHDAGDAVLIAVARAISASIRNIDLCARYGGEELALLFPQTHLADASATAQRLKRVVETTRVQLEQGEISVTASFGVAAYPESVRTQDGLFAAADKALYAAKSAGRNCVRVAAIRQPVREA